MPDVISDSSCLIALDNIGIEELAEARGSKAFTKYKRSFRNMAGEEDDGFEE